MYSVLSAADQLSRSHLFPCWKAQKTAAGSLPDAEGLSGGAELAEAELQRLLSGLPRAHRAGRLAPPCSVPHL
jgi:hypothetical protein